MMVDKMSPLYFRLIASGGWVQPLGGLGPPPSWGTIHEKTANAMHMLFEFYDQKSIG